MSTRRVASLISSVALAAGTALAVVPATVAGAARPHGSQSAACPAVPLHYARCLVHVLHPAPQRHGGGTPASTSPTGYAPRTIRTAYGFGTTGGSTQTIAVVDAYGAPTVTSNLASFSTQFTLPPCTAANGCFTKVSQTGGTSYPRATSGWALEQSLDVEWAHALAPKAHVLLVEASTASFTNLLAAVDYAAGRAHFVSMSWGGTEFSTETAYDSHFTAKGVSYFAAAGDTASAVIYPSASPDVVSVGGTTLTLTTSGSWASESAWSTAGGGCSRYESAASAQKAYPTYDQAGATCSGKRATPDISLDANPSTGVPVYDTQRLSTGLSGWIQVGGTSASTVMIAAHAAETAAPVNATVVYGSSLKVYDVVKGSNGHPCEKGYDLCTGVGSWNTAVGTSGSSSTSPTSGSLSLTWNATTAPTMTAGSTAELAVSAAPSSSPAPSSVSVTLSSSSAGGAFSASATGPYTSTLSVTVPTSSRSIVYFHDTKAGTATLSATATSWASSSLAVTVDPGPLSKITVSPTSATVAEGGTQVFRATGYDTYTNVVTAGFDPAWSTTVAGGSLSSPSGATTTFTAGSTSGTGTVSAAQAVGTSTVTGHATLTVVTVPALTVSVSASPSAARGPWYRTPVTVSVSEGTSGVSGATVVLAIYAGSSCTGTAVAQGTATTGTGGTVTLTFKTRSTGTYCAEAIASTSSAVAASQPYAFTVPVA